MSFLKTCLFSVIFPGWFRLQNQNKEFGKISPNVRLMEILRNFLPVARNDFFKQKKTYLKIPEILHCEKYATIREDAGQRNRYCGRFYTVLNFFVFVALFLTLWRHQMFYVVIFLNIVFYFVGFQLISHIWVMYQLPEAATGGVH